MIKYLEVGKIVSIHGIKGEVKVMPMCDTPEQLCNAKALYMDKQGEQKIKSERARVQKNMVILKLEGVDTPEEAVKYRNRILYCHRDDEIFNLGEGEYFIQDLIGLTVSDADTGEEYGILSDVFQTGANDVYQITFADKTERLIPAIEDVIISVDIEGSKMLIRPLKGLFDDDN